MKQVGGEGEIYVASLYWNLTKIYTTTSQTRCKAKIKSQFAEFPQTCLFCQIFKLILDERGDWIGPRVESPPPTCSGGRTVCPLDSFEDSPPSRPWEWWRRSESSGSRSESSGPPGGGWGCGRWRGPSCRPCTCTRWKTYGSWSARVLALPSPHLGKLFLIFWSFHWLSPVYTFCIAKSPAQV